MDVLKARTASRIIMGTCSIISSCGDVVDCDYSKSPHMNSLNPNCPFEIEMKEIPNQSIGSVSYVFQRSDRLMSHIYTAPSCGGD